LGCDLSARVDHRRWLTNLSGLAKRLPIICFALFFLGFLALLGFAYLLTGAVTHADLAPALVAASV
jgi:hypothetical protein